MNFDHFGEDSLNNYHSLFGQECPWRGLVTSQAGGQRVPVPQRAASSKVRL